MNNQTTPLLGIFRWARKFICNECFNKLPIEQRKGRGARAPGWAPADCPKKTCQTCGREGVYTEPENEGG